MKLNFSHERVLAVVAHPDDAELLCAGTLARAKADGASIGVAVLCRGEKGQPAEPIENLGNVRSREMQAAAKLLGADFLEGGFPDGELVDSAESSLSCFANSVRRSSSVTRRPTTIPTIALPRL